MAQLQPNFTVKISLLLLAVCSSSLALRLGDVQYGDDHESVEGRMNGVSSSLLETLERRNFPSACIFRPCYQMALTAKKLRARVYLKYRSSKIHYSLAKPKKRRRDSRRPESGKPGGFRPPRSKEDKKLARKLRRCIFEDLERRCNIPPKHYVWRTYFKRHSRPHMPFDFGDRKVLRCVNSAVRPCARREGFTRVAVIRIEGPNTVEPSPSVDPMIPICNSTRPVTRPTPTCKPQTLGQA